MKSPKPTDTNIDDRTKEFSRNLLLEELLKDLNDNLWDSEQRLLSKYSDRMKMPLILIMGPMRSGTTLFMQWLANTGLVSYPTNLLSRFYHAPIIGLKIQQLLTDPRYNFRDELGEFIQQTEYRSVNGKTKGALAPNEFWYFWRRFLAEPSRDVWTDKELHQTMDVNTMKTEIIGMMDVIQKPFAAKGMLFNYNISFLNSVFDKIIFIQVKRDMVTNISSALEARKRQFGNQREWYSFKIPEFPILKELDPITQTAGQLHYINNAVNIGLEKVDIEKKMVVQYEDFCHKPRQVFDELIHKLKLERSDFTYRGEELFFKSRDSNVPNRQVIEKAISYFQ